MNKASLLNKIGILILVFAMACQIMRPLTVYAATNQNTEQSTGQNSAEYQIYLADFLKTSSGLKGDLSQNMLHRQVYEVLNENGLYYKAVDCHQILTELGSSEAVQGKEPLYRQMILEILYKQLNNDETKEWVRNIFFDFGDAILEVTGEGLDYGPEVFTANGALWSVVACNSAKEVFEVISASDIMSRTINGSITSAEWKLTGAKALVNVAKNGVDYIDKLSLYLALSECRAGMLETLQVMYRETRDTDLRTALYHVIMSIEAMESDDVCEAIGELSYDFAWNAAWDVCEGMLSDMLGISGLTVNFVTMMVNVDMNVEKIAELSLMLEALVTIEDQLKSAITYNMNVYRGDYEDACALNESVTMLYDTYEYGTELVTTFFTELWDKGNRNNKITELLNEKRKEELGEGAEEIKRSDDFTRIAQTYQGIVDSGRTVFEIVWEMYQEETGRNSSDKREALPIFAEAIQMDDTPLTVELGTGTSAVYAKVIPSNAQDSKLIYTSTNESVVTVDEYGFLTPVNTGTAYITVTTVEGNLTARRQVIVVEKEEKIDRDIRLNSEGDYDYTSYYHDNEDGISLEHMIPLDTEYCTEHGIDVEAMFGAEPGTHEYVGNTHFETIWVIPAYIDGKPVTELDFKGNAPNGRYYNVRLNQENEMTEVYCDYGVVQDNYNHDYMYYLRGDDKYRSKDKFYTVYLPSTVKRITDGCFEYANFAQGIVLNEGLEEIGEKAFYKCTMWELLEDQNGELVDIYKQMEDNYGHHTFEIPSTVKSIGASAFEYADFMGMGIWIQSNLDVIPELCFSKMENVDTVRFAEEAMIGTIAKEAFLGLEADNVYLPDTVSEIGENAFENCSIINRMPSELRKIGDYAFEGATFAEGSYMFPDSVEEIGHGAFMYAGLTKIWLPDTIKRIGAYAFAASSLEAVYAYQSEEAGQREEGIIEENAFECDYLEIPDNIKSLSYQKVGNELVLPEGLTQLKMIAGNTKESLVVRVRDGDGIYEKNGTLGKLFYDDTNVDYLEIPGAFAESFHLGAFDNFAKYNEKRSMENKRMISVIRIKGVVKEIVPGKYADEFADFVSGAVYALDEEGNEICLFRGPSPYTKISLSQYENEDDYKIDFPEETNQIVMQKIPASEEGMTSNVKVNADDETISLLEGGKLQIYGWKEDNSENRALELGEFLRFEDLYLKQIMYMYFRIEVQKEEENVYSQPGSYQIIASIPDGWGEDLACYHIDQNGLITRLQGELYKENSYREYRALSSDIGSFALVWLYRDTETIDSCWLEELHEKLDVAEKDISQESQNFIVGKGKVTIGVSDKNDLDAKGPNSTEPNNTEPDSIESGSSVSGRSEAKEILAYRPEVSERELSIIENLTGIDSDVQENVLEIRTVEDETLLELQLSAAEGYRPILFYMDSEKESEMIQDVAQEGKANIENNQENDLVSGQYKLTLKEPGRYLILLTDEEISVKKPFQIKIILIGAGTVALLMLLCVSVNRKLAGYLYRGRKSRRAGEK